MKLRISRSIFLFVAIAALLHAPAARGAVTLYVSNNQPTINQVSSTGVVSTFATGIATPSFIAIAVPEPSHALLLVFGTASLLMRRRRTVQFLPGAPQ